MELEFELCWLCVWVDKTRKINFFFFCVYVFVDCKARREWATVNWQLTTDAMIA